jgi:hypothetical protein
MSKVLEFNSTSAKKFILENPQLKYKYLHLNPVDQTRFVNLHMKLKNTNRSDDSDSSVVFNAHIKHVVDISTSDRHIIKMIKSFRKKFDDNEQRERDT